MDDASSIETFRAGLRLQYAADVGGLRRYVDELMRTVLSPADEITITSHGFVDGSASGQAQFSRMAKLNAALAVLAELDATVAATIAGTGSVRYADFSGMLTEP